MSMRRRGPGFRLGGQTRNSNGLDSLSGASRRATGTAKLASHTNAESLAPWWTYLLSYARRALSGYVRASSSAFP